MVIADCLNQSWNRVQSQWQALVIVLADNAQFARTLSARACPLVSLDCCLVLTPSARSVWGRCLMLAQGK